MNRATRSSRHLTPPQGGEHLHQPFRGRHHAHYTSGRIHFSSCSSSRVPRPFATRGARASMTPSHHHEALAMPAAVVTSAGGRIPGLSHTPGSLVLAGHRPAGAHVAEIAIRRNWTWYVKRALDSVIAAVALVLSAPVMLLCAVAVRRDGAGPIIYSQVRVGVNRRHGPGTASAFRNGHERRHRAGYGRPFRIFKFRSMVQGAEKGTGAVWCAQGDPRITRVGNFLRKTHLDELPQLVNVLRGEMSMVGPRPERPEFVEKLAAELPGYRQRSAVLPGITGLAQVKYRYDRDIDTARTKLLYDLHYIRNSGLLFDVKIMAATVGVMLPGKSD
jgi:lipopolysaccharide/colanic/teichoic acid biosynthesis glycosyltransferase